ncbi:MAG: hypothetical protein ACWGSD_16275, partial [Thermodesulfobacteriota bacterium]
MFRRISRRRNVAYSALVPNEKGLERALEAKVDKVSVFTSASETFNRKNINTSIEGSIQRFVPVVESARREGLPVRGYVPQPSGAPLRARSRLRLRWMSSRGSWTS